MTSNQLLEKAGIVYRKYKNCKEIQRKITVNTLISVTHTIIWYFIWLSSALNYFSKSWATFNPKNILMYITIIVLVIVPFFLFKPQKWLQFFRPFAGKIKSRTDKIVRVDRVSTQHKIIIKANSLDGHKKYKEELKLFPGMMSYYRPEGYIVRLRGVKYPVKFELTEEEKNSEQVFCPMCGHYSPRRYERCFDCRSPLWSKDIM